MDSNCICKLNSFYFYDQFSFTSCIINKSCRCCKNWILFRKILHIWRAKLPTDNDDQLETKSSKTVQVYLLYCVDCVVFLGKTLHYASLHLVPLPIQMCKYYQQKCRGRGRGGSRQWIGNPSRKSSDLTPTDRFMPHSVKLRTMLRLPHPNSSGVHPRIVALI